MKHTQEENRKRFPRLFAWWQAARAHGTVYSRVDVSRSGMSATVLLWTVQDGRLEVAWPDTYEGEGKDAVASDACAKLIGFSFARRAFRVNGCGFDRAHQAMENVACVFEKYEGSEKQLRSWPRKQELNSPGN